LATFVFRIEEMRFGSYATKSNHFTTKRVFKIPNPRFCSYLDRLFKCQVMKNVLLNEGIHLEALRNFGHYVARSYMKAFAIKPKRFT